MINDSQPRRGCWTRGQVNSGKFTASLEGICSGYSGNSSHGSLLCADRLIRTCSDPPGRDGWKPERGGFEMCIDGLSFWLMRIAREIGRGTSVQALRERRACQERADAQQAALPVQSLRPELP